MVIVFQGKTSAEAEHEYLSRFTKFPQICGKLMWIGKMAPPGTCTRHIIQDDFCTHESYDATLFFLFFGACCAHIDQEVDFLDF